ncbi:tRNA preQ1(34) S-adenosylmethionine ribosyltransferase-isomerase QueA [Planctomycetota bacterium]
MKTQQLHYDLPGELIAQRPAEVRSQSRLLVFDRLTGEIKDMRFDQIGQFLRNGDCLVVNDTKVLAARFFGCRKTGAKLEGLFLAEKENGDWEIMLKGAGKVKVDEKFIVKDKDGGEFAEAVLVEKLGQGRCLIKVEADGACESVLERIGFAPLPPYIKRDDDVSAAAIDRRRYQTVYAANGGAVAAPTAGLHFTEQLITELKEAGVCFANVTLHVGAGTFQPITVENLEEHDIHEERFSIDESNAEIINTAKANGGRIIAVGTTSVRTLETVAEGGSVRAGSGVTKLFVTPGYEFKAVDAMITNFHLPGSTLLALVGAFAGLENTLAAYRHAIEQRYRFYSYGDAMIIL